MSLETLARAGWCRSIWDLASHLWSAGYWTYGDNMDWYPGTYVTYLLVLHILAKLI